MLDVSHLLIGDKYEPSDHSKLPPVTSVMTLSTFQTRRELQEAESPRQA